MIYLINIVIFSAIFFLVLSMLSRKEKIGLNLPPAEEIDFKRDATPKISLFSQLAKINRPLLKGFIKYREQLVADLSLARWRLFPEEFVLIKELLTIGFVLLFTLIIDKSNNFYMPLLLVTIVLGFFLPDIVLKAKLKSYRQKIVHVLPDTVDLLTLCVSAGLDFMVAVRWVIEKSTPNPLIDELTMVLQEIKIGKPRAEALKNMGERLNIPDVYSFVRSLIQADKMGTSVAEALAILSEDTRLQRFRRGERAALKAPIKMLIPLIIFILPVVFIIVAAPVLLQFMQGGLAIK